MTREQAIKKALALKLDPHTYTASLHFGVPFNEVTSEMRTLEMSLNFVYLYSSRTKMSEIFKHE